MVTNRNITILDTNNIWKIMINEKDEIFLILLERQIII